MEGRTGADVDIEVGESPGSVGAIIGDESAILLPFVFDRIIGLRYRRCLCPRTIGGQGFPTARFTPTHKHLEFTNPSGLRTVGIASCKFPSTIYALSHLHPTSTGIVP